MKDYKVIKPVSIPCGLIRLSEKQADPRSEGIKHKGRDVYEVMTPQTFKAGEVFGLKDVSKALKPSLEDIEAVAKSQAEEPAAKKVVGKAKR